MDIFEEVRKQNFPSGHYIVVGSGIMVVKGIRDTQDLDIVVSEALFEQCKAEGWETHEWTKAHIPGKPWLRKGNVELYIEISRKTGGIPLEGLLAEAEVIQGIPFITLERLIDFKKEYGRQKDFEDIEMIEQYLRNTQSS